MSFRVEIGNEHAAIIKQLVQQELNKILAEEEQLLASRVAVRFKNAIPTITQQVDCWVDRMKLTNKVEVRISLTNDQSQGEQHASY